MKDDMGETKMHPFEEVNSCVNKQTIGQQENKKRDRAGKSQQKKQNDMLLMTTSSNHMNAKHSLKNATLKFLDCSAGGHVNEIQWHFKCLTFPRFH